MIYDNCYIGGDLRGDLNAEIDEQRSAGPESEYPAVNAPRQGNQVGDIHDIQDIHVKLTHQRY